MQKGIGNRKKTENKKRKNNEAMHTSIYINQANKTEEKYN